MAFQHCAACPSPGACAETTPPEGFKAPIAMNGAGRPGMCLNAYAALQAAKAPQDAGGSNDPAPAPAQHPAAKAPSGPPAARSGPGEGTAATRIFAACTAALQALGHAQAKGQPEAVLRQAKDAAVPALEAAGIHPSTARQVAARWVRENRAS